MSSSVIDQLVARQQRAIKDFEAGRAAKAVAAGRQNIAVARRELGERHPLLEELLGSVGKMHQATGALAEAEALFAERVRIRRTVGGATDPQLVAPLLELSEVRLGMGNRSAAQQLAEEALSVCRANAGEDTASLARPLNLLASVYLATNQPRAALRSADEALDLLADADGRDAGALRIECQITRGRSAEAALDFDLAERAFEAAAKASADLFGRAGPAAIVCHGHLGRVKQRVGDFAAADRHFERAAALAGEYVGVKSLDYAQRVIELASCRSAAGNLPEFLRLSAEADRVVRAALGGADTPAYAGFLAEVPPVLDAAGRWAEAAKLREAALAIAAADPANPESDRVPIAAGRSVGLAVRDLAAAEAGMARVRAVLAADPNADPRMVVRARTGHLLMLGRLGKRDELEAAANELLRELRIHEWAETSAEVIAHAALAHVARERGDSATAVREGQTALEIAEKRCGRRHPTTVTAHDTLAAQYGAAGRWAESVRHARRYAAGRLAVHRHARRARPWEGSADVDGLARSASEAITAALAVTGDERATVAAAAFAVVAVAAASALDGQAPSDLADLPAGPEVSALRRACAVLREAIHDDPPDAETDDFAERIDALADEADAAEAAVVAVSPRVAARVRMAGGIDVDAVRRALPADARLACYVRYTPADFGGSSVGGPRPYWQDARYALFFVRPHRERPAVGDASAGGESSAGEASAATDPVTLVDLGPAAAIDAAVARWATSADPSAADAAGRELAAAMFAPVARLAGTCRRLFVVSDGELARVPIDALPAGDAAPGGAAAGGAATPAVGGRYVFDDWQVDHLTCPGDLLPLPPAAVEADPAAPVLFTDPPLEQDVAGVDPVELPIPAPPRTPAALRRWMRVAAAIGGRLAAKTRLSSLPGVGGWGRAGTGRGGAAAPADLTSVLSPTFWPAASVDLPLTAGPVAAAAASGSQGAPTMPEALAANERCGPACTDGALVGVRSPRVLVVDAPWFALPAEPDDVRDPRVGPVVPARVPRPRYGAEVESPLVRAGVATAGFAAAARAAAAGRWIESADDGVVTARDVYGMDLSATQLVVLSRPAGLAASAVGATATPSGTGAASRPDGCGQTVAGLLRAWVAAGSAGLAVRLPVASAEADRADGAGGVGTNAGGRGATVNVAQAMLDAHAGGAAPADALRAARRAVRAADPADRSWMAWAFYATA